MDEEREFHFDAGTLVGDLRDAMLHELKDVADGKPWNERPEAQQRAVVDRIHSAARGMVNRAVLLMSNKGFASLHGELVQVQVKDGFKAVVEIPRGADFRHELVDAAGKDVVLVLATSEEFRGTRGAVPITPPAPLLDYAAQAAKVAEDAEKGVVWWHPDHPEETFDGLDEYEAHHDHQHMVPFEVCRTGWLAPRWVVTFLIGNAEGDVVDDDAQFFDTEAEAKAFVESLQGEKAEATEPEGGTPVEEAPAATAEEAPDEGVLLDEPSFAAALEGYAKFVVRTVADGSAVWHVWKDAQGDVRGHDDLDQANAIAARQKEQADDDAWDTAEDRQAKKRKRRGAAAEEPAS